MKKSDSADLPSGVRARLPRYYRYIRELFGSDVLRISSSELSSMLGITASQIRQDLSRIGQLGQQGYGYNVKDLYSGIGEVLGVNIGFGAVLAGLSGIGAALAAHPVFEMRGVKLRACFDDGLTGKEIAGMTIKPIKELEDYCREKRIDILVLASERGQAPDIAAAAVRAGVRGIWNFTGEDIRAGRAKNTLAVSDINLCDSLMCLCSRLR